MIADVVRLLREAEGRRESLLLAVTRDGDRIDGLDVDDVTTVGVGTAGKGSADAARLPYADSSYGYVVAADVLQHADRSTREALVAELRRVAVKGVVVEGSFPADEARRLFAAHGDAAFVLSDGQMPLSAALGYLSIYGMASDARTRRLADELSAFAARAAESGNGTGPPARRVLIALRDPAHLDLGGGPLAGRTGETAGLAAQSMIGALPAIALSRELDRAHSRLAELDRRLGEREAALALKDAQVTDLSRRLGGSVRAAALEKARSEQLRAEMDRVVETRAWRAITAQKKARKWVAERFRRAWQWISAPFRRRSS